MCLILGLLYQICHNSFVSQKQSIRKQIDKAKKEIADHLAKEKISPAFIATINSLLLILDVVVTVLLEKKTRKNSSNSGTSPSHDIGSTKNNRNKKKKRKKTKKKGQELDNSHHEKEEKISSPDKCHNCHADLQDEEIIKKEERKMIDIEYIIKETVVVAQTKECPDCGEQTTGKFPQGMDGIEQYGIGIRTGIIDMMIFQMISLIRIQEYFKGLIGRNISQAIMLKYNTQLGMSLDLWQQKMIREILKFPVIYVDETSFRVNGKLCWIHTYSAGNIVLQFIHPNRGTEAIDAIGIIPQYKGIIVHDRYASYFTYTHLVHALCLSHLIRDLKFVEDSIKDKWATRLKRLLKTAINMVNEKENRILSEEEYEKLRILYRQILLDALLELPDFKNSEGKGKTKLTEAQNLWVALFEYEKSVLLFTRIPEVDATNNRSERDLRMNKVKQKVAGCFRKFQNAVWFCRNRSFLMTMRNLGFSSMKAIQLALQGNFPIYKNTSGNFVGLQGSEVLSGDVINRSLESTPSNRKITKRQVNLPIDYQGPSP